MANAFLSNLHTHTRYGDGSGTAEECVLAAIRKGLVSIGFAEHAWAPYDTDCCIAQEEIPRYLAEVRALRERYAGEIEVYLGWENDAFCPAGRESTDFLIGSVHYLRDRGSGRYYGVDYLTADFERALRELAGGDIRELVRLYYAEVAGMALGQRPDILGHLDLIVKLNAGNRYFDPAERWYEALVEGMAADIRRSGCIVEVNTGGLQRGYTAEPYPSRRILRMLRARDIPLTLSSDAHEPEAVDFYFPEALEIIRQAGYKSLWQMRGGRFIEVEI